MKKELSVTSSSKSDLSDIGNIYTAYSGKVNPGAEDDPFEYRLPTVSKSKLWNYDHIRKTLTKLENYNELREKLGIYCSNRNTKVVDQVLRVHYCMSECISHVKNIFNISYTFNDNIVGYDFKNSENNTLFTILVIVEKRSVIVGIDSKNVLNARVLGNRIASENVKYDVSNLVFTLMNEGLKQYNDKIEIFEESSYYKLDRS